MHGQILLFIKANTPSRIVIMTHKYICSQNLNYSKSKRQTWTGRASTLSLAVILVANGEVDASWPPGQQIWLGGLHLGRKAGRLLCLGLVKRLKWIFLVSPLLVAILA